ARGRVVHERSVDPSLRFGLNHVQFVRLLARAVARVTLVLEWSADPSLRLGLTHVQFVRLLARAVSRVTLVLERSASPRTRYRRALGRRPSAVLRCYPSLRFGLIFVRVVTRGA